MSTAEQLALPASRKCEPSQQWTRSVEQNNSQIGLSRISSEAKSFLHPVPVFLPPNNDVQEIEVWDCFLLEELSPAVVPFSLPPPPLLPPPLPHLLHARPLPPPHRLPPLRPPRPHARHRPWSRTLDVSLDGRPPP